MTAVPTVHKIIRSCHPANFHQMFVDCVPPIGWALVKAIQAFKKSHDHGDSVFVELFVSRSHLDVHFLRDIGI